ncbi:MAG: 30S ribosome-binding factor RbfA [Gemmatimonadales bacterium]
MRGSSRRPEQVAENIRQVLAELIGREVRDPRVGHATITRVEVTGDLSYAKVYVAVLGDEVEKEKAVEGLGSAAGFLRSKLARVLTTRTVPQLTFELDRGLEHATRINTLLDQVNQERRD